MTPETYPDSIWKGTVELVEQVQMAERIFRIRFHAPELAQALLPGQFVMIRFPETNDPLLGRPIAVYDVTASDDPKNPGMVDLVYLVVGKLTKELCTRPVGTKLTVWGPLGNGFPAYETDHLIFVAGGIGQTPFITLAKERLGRQTFGTPARVMPPVKRISLCYGARKAGYLAGVDDFRQGGVDVQIATEDGSAGIKGLVTDLIGPLVEMDRTTRPQVVACGPKPMIAAVIETAKSLDVPCDVSLESPMACGMGICFSCVTKIRGEDGQWDYKRTCVDGPVFDGKLVILE